MTVYTAGEDGCNSAPPGTAVPNLDLGAGTVHHFLAFRRQNGAKRLEDVGFFRRLAAFLKAKPN
jgi:hypothetical protein